MFGHSDVDASRAEPDTEEVGLLVQLVTVFRPMYVIETGTYRGNTTRAIAEVLPASGHIDSMDTCADCVKNVLSRVVGLPATVFLGSSLDFVPALPIDFAFLDSDPDIRHAELDHFRPYLAPGSVFAMHDTRSSWTDDPSWTAVHLKTSHGLTLLQPAGTVPCRL